MRKNYSILIMAMMAVSSAYGEVTPEVSAIRTDAVNTLCRTLPETFVSRETFVDAMLFIEKELDPAVHQRLLELQTEADELNTIKTQMLAISGVTVNSPAVKSVDKMLNDIAQKFNDILYNDGVFSWRTVLSLGVGLNAGLYSGATYKGKVGAATTIDKAWRGVWIGLVAAMILEFSLRGRKAIIAGSMYSLVKFVLNVIHKFFSSMFGSTGVSDQWLASLEKKLRSVGSKLDCALNNKWGMSGVLVLTAAASGLIWHQCMRA